MRRTVTWLLAAALAGLGLAAAVDALIRDADPASRAARAPTTAPLLARQPELAVAQLREAGVSGVLTFSDEDCRLHAVSLPELEPRRAPSFEMCSPVTAIGGLGAVGGEVVWSGLGYGAVQTVLSRERLSRELARARRGVFSLPAGYTAEHAVPLAHERLAVLAAAVEAPWERVVGLFDGPRLVTVAAALVAEDARLRPSPHGRYFAVLEGTASGLRLYRQDGSLVALPSVRRPHAIAWSPDERWTAVATAESVYVVPSERPGELVIRIPLAVRDLDWSA